MQQHFISAGEHSNLELQNEHKSVHTNTRFTGVDTTTEIIIEAQVPNKLYFRISNRFNKTILLTHLLQPITQPGIWGRLKQKAKDLVGAK